VHNLCHICSELAVGFAGTSLQVLDICHKICVDGTIASHAGPHRAILSSWIPDFSDLRGTHMELPVRSY
jgi:hypothetical protein